MNERVKEFLDAKKLEEKKKYEQRKNTTLIKLGLFEKVYSEKEEYSAAFPYSEYDSEKHTAQLGAIENVTATKVEAAKDIIEESLETENSETKAPAEENSGIPVFVWFIIGGAALLIAGGVVVLVIIKRRKERCKTKASKEHYLSFLAL